MSSIISRRIPVFIWGTGNHSSPHVRLPIEVLVLRQVFLDRNFLKQGFPTVKTSPAFRLSALPFQDMLQVEKLLPPSLIPRTTFQGGINMAFADNHVELVRLERLWNLTWYRSWAAPAKRPGKGSILSSAHAVISLITRVGGHDYLPPR